MNQEFPEEVEIRENQDYDSEEEMTSETEETDDELETNNTNVNNYLDSANMATNLETAMKIAEEEDLWIGDSRASSHICRILGLTTFNSLLQYVNRLAWEICSVN